MLSVLLFDVVIVSGAVGAALAGCVRAGFVLWEQMAGRAERERVFLLAALSSSSSSFSSNSGGASASAFASVPRGLSSGDGGASVGGACGQPVVGALGSGGALLVGAVHGLSSRTVHTVPEARSTVVPAPGSVGVRS